MSGPTQEFEHGYTCQQVVDLATEYVEGALASSEASLVELQLNVCDGCSTFIDQIRATASLAGQLLENQVSDEMWVKLLTAFREWRRT